MKQPRSVQSVKLEELPGDPAGAPPKRSVIQSAPPSVTIADLPTRPHSSSVSSVWIYRFSRRQIDVNRSR